jgi:hypothetical protein
MRISATSVRQKKACEEGVHNRKINGPSGPVVHYQFVKFVTFQDLADTSNYALQAQASDFFCKKVSWIT